MKKRILFICLSIPVICNAQNLIDSLKKMLPLPADDSIKVLQYIDLGLEYYRIDVDSSLLFIEQGLALAKKMKDNYLIGAGYNSMGVAYYYKRDFTQAMDYYMKALPLAKASKDDDFIARVLGNIGIVQQETGQNQEAIQTQLEVLNIYKARNDTMEIGRAYLHLGAIYYALQNYDKTLEYFFQTLTAFQQVNSIVGLGIINSNIGEVYLAIKDYKNAQKHWSQALEYQLLSNDKGGAAITRMGLGELSLKQQNPEAAIVEFNQALQLAKESGDNRTLITLYKHLAETHQQLNNLPKAYTFLSQYATLSDSLNKITYNQDLAEMQTKFDTERKEAEIAQQKLELAQKNAQIFRQRTSIWGLIFTLLGLIVFAYLFYNRYRLKQQQIINEAIIHEQKLGLNAVIEAQEAEQSRIAKELHDGIAQELVAVKLGFDRLALKMKNLASTEAENIMELSNLLNETCIEVRTISHLMLPPTLEKEGLVSSLQLLLENSLKRLGVAHEFHYTDINERFDTKIEWTVYRIAQELINNILKHAQATQIAIELQKADNSLIFKVEDDGKGYDFEAARSKGSLGLLNILSRVSNLGGTFVAEPKAQRGTVSLVQIPL